MTYGSAGKRENLTILAVDDDELSLDMLEHALTTAGYLVETASDGLKALEILRQRKCRLVISDWEMPGVDGLELCRAVRDGNLSGYVYFILLTSHSDPDDIVTGMSAGADDFITKPFNPAELAVRVRAGERVLALESRDVMIFTLAKLAESRDPESGRHLERVRNYSHVLTRQLLETGAFPGEIDEGYCRLIYLTSPLHDIGKIGIPDNVLLKPGPLTDEEFDVMKTHATLGEETLQAALDEHPGVEFLRIARDIAAAHHERFDGKGYPRGLAGDDIPLCGRIVAVADVYDALTSKRVYKEAYSHDVARGIIAEESGSHFDSRVADAFLAAEERFVAVSRRYGEVPVPA